MLAISHSRRFGSAFGHCGHEFLRQGRDGPIADVRQLIRESREAFAPPEHRAHRIRGKGLLRGAPTNDRLPQMSALSAGASARDAPGLVLCFRIPILNYSKTSEYLTVVRFRNFAIA